MPTSQFNMRLKARHREMIAAIADYQGGLSRTRVIELAIERLHTQIFPPPGKKREKSPVTP